jgi:hypothetical protein
MRAGTTGGAGHRGGGAGNRRDGAGRRRLGAALACGLAAVAIAAVPGAAAGAGSATASKAECQLTAAEINGGLVASYVYSLKVRNVSCEKGKKLVAKFHQCRHDNGGRNGHCSSVKGYNCKEKQLDSSEQLLQAKATCKKGSKKFKQTFGESR